MTQIEIPVEELSAVLNKAILDSLSAETRERLIQGALQHLMTANTDRYSGKTKTPLQDQFEMALNRIAGQVADEVIKSSGVSDQLTERFTEILANIEDWSDDRYEAQEILIRALVFRIDELRKSRR